MFQTSYTGLKPLQSNSTYVGGFCQFWYIPVENVTVFPRVGAGTQILVGEPALAPDAAWFGPILVPRDKLGFSEVLKRTAAGPYYEIKVEGVHIGDSPESRVNLENMPYHKYLVVGKVRAGGFHLLIGTKGSPCRFDTEHRGGASPLDTAQTIFSFFTEHINKALVLPSFEADAQSPASGGAGNGGGSDMIEPEIIPFVNQSVINIPWTATRLVKFGKFPDLEVWIEEPGEKPYLSRGGSIEVDAPPPQTTEFTIKPGGVLSGFIRIK